MEYMPMCFTRAVSLCLNNQHAGTFITLDAVENSILPYFKIFC